MSERRVAVVGLGLIGGSLARDLAAAGARVYGYDADLATLRAACTEGIVHTPLDASLDGVAACDVLVLAVPVSAAPAVLARAAPHCGDLVLVTDTGSTKRSIEERARVLGLGPRFVGSHPLTGDHRSGWPAARAGLFDGATVYLCPAGEASLSALEAAHELWSGVGASPQITGAPAHDELLAWTSHLPQVVSSALARALLAAGASADQLGPGSRDMTRLAASSADVWTGIAVDNADHLLPAIERMQAELAVLQDALQRRDAAAIRSFFDAVGNPSTA